MLAIPPATFPPKEVEVTAAFAAGPHRRIDVGHSRLAYWRFGTGPHVVFIHGWPLHGATFRRVIPALADDFTLHVIDLPGTGMTDWDGGSPTDLLSHVSTVRCAIEALDLSRYAFVAHDSGGTIARMVAADDERVRGLVLGNTEIPGHDSAILRALVLSGRAPGARLTLFGPLRSRRYRRALFGGCFTDPAYAEGEFKDLFIRPLFGSKRVAEGQLRFLRTLDLGLVDALAGVHARIRAPVLCIWGDRDRWFPIAKARAMMAQFRAGADLVGIEEARVFVHEDRAAEFAAAALPFLRRCLSPSITRSV